MELLTETAIWPLALTLAAVTAAERVRGARRRADLNRALHELRRPLQALLLTHAAPPDTARQAPGGLAPPGPARAPSLSRTARAQLEQALAALAQLDAAINGVGGSRGRSRVAARELLAAAVERWQAAAAIAGRELELRWAGDEQPLRCDPGRISQALDNLIANALEHARGAIRVEGGIAAGRVRLAVSDGGAARPAGFRSSPGAAGRRRGHGLRLAAAVAAEHGGELAVRDRGDGTTVALELPPHPAPGSPASR